MINLVRSMFAPNPVAAGARCTMTTDAADVWGSRAHELNLAGYEIAESVEVGHSSRVLGG